MIMFQKNPGMADHVSNDKMIETAPTKKLSITTTGWGTNYWTPIPPSSHIKEGDWDRKFPPPGFWANPANSRVSIP